MTVTSSEIVSGAFTIFHVTGQIPNGAFYVIFNGKKYDVFPVYGSNPPSFAIKGKHEMTGKEIAFAGKLPEG